jgi:2-polyprenyl-3-methyl-5-hydroxy-6-metoxy-1,4-benzoquinol methylase
MKDHVAVTKQTYEQIAEQYASGSRQLPPDVKQNLDRFVRLFKGKTVLDIGCAGGRESGYLSGQGLTVTGCDISEKFITLATQAHPKCQFFVSDMRDLGNHTAKYDGIWCNAAFLHIPKQEGPATLKILHNLLNPAGLLYVSVMKGTFNGLRRNEQMNWPERHFTEYEQDELHDMVNKAGFETLESHTAPTDWGPIFLHAFYKSL